MAAINRDRTCENCETQCMQCRDPSMPAQKWSDSKETQRWSDASSMPDEPVGYADLPDELIEYLKKRMNHTVDDQERYFLAKQLGLSE